MASNSYGPSTQSAPSFFDAPRLVSGQDRKRWRRDVLEWVSFTKLRAESEEKTAKANVRTLGYLLYHAVHQDYKAVLDHARDSGQLSLAGGADQEKAVKTIIALVGEDNPIDVTNRILASYQKLHACVRGEEEVPSKFADRFRGLASEYMTLAGISATGKDSQMIAMVLLQNAKLDENTSNAITIQLVAKAETRKMDSALRGGKIVVNKTSVTDAKEKAVKIKDVVASLGQTPSTDPVAYLAKKRDAVEKIEELVDAISGIVSADSSPDEVPSSAPEIFLDDVHKALSTLKSSVSHRKSMVDKNIESLTKTVNRVASMLGKRTQNGDENDTARKEALQKKKARLARIKAKSTCHACREKGHWAGDPECKKTKKGESNSDDDKDADDDTQEQFFLKRDQ